MVHEDKRHSYQDGDYVKFTEVEGMTELNDAGPIEVFDCRAYSFRLKIDTSGFGQYTRQGTVEDTKVPMRVEFKSLEETVTNPGICTEFGMLQPVDMNYFGMGRSEILHLSIGGVHLFHKQNNRYPENTEEDIAAVIANVKQINSSFKERELICVEEVDEQLVRNVAAYAKCSITSQAAMFGGFIAQEIVKFTGKYMPLKQWVHYDCFESLPPGEVDRTPMNCRYDD